MPYIFRVRHTISHCILTTISHTCAINMMHWITKDWQVIRILQLHKWPWRRTSPLLGWSCLIEQIILFTSSVRVVTIIVLFSLNLLYNDDLKYICNLFSLVIKISHPVIGQGCQLACLILFFIKTSGLLNSHGNCLGQHAHIYCYSVRDCHFLCVPCAFCLGCGLAVVKSYHIAGKFGGTKFWRISQN